MASAEIKPIDEQYAGRILSSGNVVIGNLCCFAPVVSIFAGLGLMAASAYFLIPEGGPKDADETTQAILGGLLIFVGLIITGASAYWGLRNITKLGNWYIRRVARREIQSRPDAIVNPSDPEAIFVELVPRANWNRLMLETATDIGFLFVDESRREVLFEGDHEQMRIPESAILSCEVEEIFIGGQPGGMKYYFTIIELEDRELPFAYRGDMGQFGAEVRRQRARALRNRIWDLMSN